MSTSEHTSRQRIFRIFAGTLVVFALFGGIIYLGRQSAPLPESPRQNSSKEPREALLAENQYHTLLEALSNDDISQACSLCETLIPGLSRDLLSEDSPEWNILILCEEAREKNLAEEKRALLKQAAKLPPEAAIKRLAAYHEVLSLDPGDAIHREKTLALEKTILQDIQNKLTQALKEKNISRACSLCEQLPPFRLVSSEPLEPLCASAMEERRLQQIAEVLAKVKPLPASDYLGNLQGYRQLAQLDPAEDTYWEKIERYRESAEKAQGRMLRRASARMSYDLHTGTFWYLPSIAEKREASGGAHAYFYIGKKDDSTPPQLRFVCLLRRENPFKASQVLLSFDDARYALPLQEKWVHFQDGFLWCDIPLPEAGEALELFRAFAHAQKGSFSLPDSGEEPFPGRTLSKEEFAGLRQMLQLYEELRK